MYKCLNGDLNQMYKQFSYLTDRGFDVITEGGIPQVESSSYGLAVLEIYENSISGWWNYRDYLISHGICTQEQFMEKLRWGRSKGERKVKSC